MLVKVYSLCMRIHIHMCIYIYICIYIHAHVYVEIGGSFGRPGIGRCWAALCPRRAGEARQLGGRAVGLLADGLILDTLGGTRSKPPSCFVGFTGAARGVDRDCTKS